MSEVKSESFLTKILRVLKMLGRGLRHLGRAIVKTFKRFGRGIKRAWRGFMRRFTKWIDPKLEKHRPHKPSPKPVEAEKPTPDHEPAVSPEIPKPVVITTDLPPESPKTRADLLEIVRSAPLSVFSRHERNIISAIFTLPETKVSEIMIPADKIVYIEASEVLGPLVLDRLYKSGLEHFPVRNPKKDIIGCIHTTHLNNLEVREACRADEVLDPGVYYVRDDYTLEQALDTFLRANCHFFVVVNRFGRVVGLLYFTDLCNFIFGKLPSHDDFSRDNDRLAVARREFAIDLEKEREEKHG